MVGASASQGLLRWMFGDTSVCRSPESHPGRQSLTSDMSRATAVTLARALSPSITHCSGIQRPTEDGSQPSEDGDESDVDDWRGDY